MEEEGCARDARADALATARARSALAARASEPQRTRARLAPMIKIETICRESRLGDWFLLYQLGKNMDPLVFRDFINELYSKLENQKDADVLRS